MDWKTSEKLNSLPPTQTEACSKFDACICVLHRYRITPKRMNRFFFCSNVRAWFKIILCRVFKFRSRIEFVMMNIECRYEICCKTSLTRYMTVFWVFFSFFFFENIKVYLLHVIKNVFLCLQASWITMKNKEKVNISQISGSVVSINQHERFVPISISDFIRMSTEWLYP